jgi:hypothetical protein
MITDIAEGEPEERKTQQPRGFSWLLVVWCRGAPRDSWWLRFYIP